MMVHKVSSVRLLSYSQELEDGKPLYVSSNSLPIKASKFEPAGHSFHSVALRLSGYHEDVSEEDNESISSNAKEKTYAPSFDSYSTKSKKKSGDGKQHDHYALLGLSHLRYLANEEQIRKSYREIALKYHPDKQASLLLAEQTEAARQTKKDEIENHFKAIQEAYEVLMDPLRRRIYDSTDEFDDEIPTECAPQDFFRVFSPAFMRNSRWSVTQPAPSMGDENTPLLEVDKFYNFWYSFKSWREFPNDDEFDLEQAESRDHKRWMERQNAKLSEKARKEEYARIRTLVDNAYKRDPRIIKRKETEKAERQKKKQAKYLTKRVQEEEAARVVEEEKRKKEEADKIAAEAAALQKKAKEKEKKLLRKEKTRLRTLTAVIVSQPKAYSISEEDVESLCMSLDMEKLKGLCDRIDGREKEEQATLLQHMLGRQGGNNDSEGQPEINGVEPKVKVPQQNGVISSGGGSNNVKKEKPWAKDEIELLRKGIQKYPKGTSRRWEVISEFIGTGRSVEEILKATKTVLLQKPDNSKAFDSFLEKRKPAAAIASPLSTRDGVQAAPTVNGPGNVSSYGKDTVSESSSSGASNDNQSDPPVVAANDTDSTATTTEQDTWSAIQERALVQALKTFPKETAQRWERVATAVPGKSMNQCKKKFASLKENFRSKKSAFE